MDMRGWNLYRKVSFDPPIVRCVHYPLAQPDMRIPVCAWLCQAIVGKDFGKDTFASGRASWMHLPAKGAISLTYDLSGIVFEKFLERCFHCLSPGILHIGHQ